MINKSTTANNKYKSAGDFGCSKLISFVTHTNSHNGRWKQNPAASYYERCVAFEKTPYDTDKANCIGEFILNLKTV